MARYHVVPATLIVFLLTACSSGNHTTSAPAAPVFTSTPLTQAVEASPYTYQVAATGTAVAYSLTSEPTGATLSGNTISWTPTAQQSRVSNSFTVAATAGGASATQSWAVTPSGTIRISRIDTLWNESGSTTTPFDWSPLNSYVAALVPQPDGSFKSLSGTAGANGTFEIPNVPAGYYWLKLGPRDTYWTNSSTFDVGSDVFVPTGTPTAPTTSTTHINFTFTSLDATATSGLLQLQWDTLDTRVPAYSALTNPGSTTLFGAFGFGSNLDFSAIKNAFVRQYEPTAFGSINGYVLGPALKLSNLSLTTGGLNTITGALNPAVPASINLSVKGSAWAPLFDHSAPTAPAALGGSFYLSVQPYISADGPNVSLANPIDLIWTSGNFSRFLTPSSCPTNSTTVATLSTNPPLTTSTNPPLTTDVEAGTVQYSDPFPSTWRGTFHVCQSASVAVPVPGGITQGFILTNTQTTSLPTAAVKPLLSAVQNPKINGADLFTAATISNTAVTLSWDPPAIGAPFGYTVDIMGPTTLISSPTTLPSPNGSIAYLTSATLSTAKTSMTIPPDLLRSGQTYLFVITSRVDGRANMETSPHRSSLPVANADVISAPITISTVQ